MKKIILMLMLMLGFFAANAQGNIVKGRLYILKGLPLNNVEVFALKTGERVKTDTNGCFEIICADKDIITITSKDLITPKIKVKSTDKDSLILRLEFIHKDEVVARLVKNGYIKPEQEEYVLKQMVIKDYSHFTNMWDAIKSEYYGARVEGSCVYLNQGASSLYLSQCALLLLDGMEVPNYDQVNLNDVVEIKIVRNTEAAQWGVRGSNGVVIVNTIK